VRSTVFLRVHPLEAGMQTNHTGEIEERVAADEHGYVTGTVAVDAGDLLENDLDGQLDLLSMALVNSEALMDVSPFIIGVDENQMLAMEVTGDPSMVLDLLSDDDEEVDG